MENQVDLQEKYIDEKGKIAYKQLKEHYSSDKSLLLKLKKLLSSSDSKTVEISSLLGNSKVKMSKNALEVFSLQMI